MTSLEIPGLNRTKKDNIFNYTDDQLATKNIALKTMKDLYPLSNEYYNEMIYDLCVNTSDEDMAIIKKNIEEKPFKYKDKPLLFTNEINK